MTKREAAGLIVVKRDGALRPVSSFDAEQMAAFVDGAEFDVKPRGKRSLPMHRLYWAALSGLLKATSLGDRYPSPTHLHEELMFDLGYVRPAFPLDGSKPRLVRDSIAFDAMPQAEFAAFFERAMARLADVTGVDPLATNVAA